MAAPDLQLGYSVEVGGRAMVAAKLWWELNSSTHNRKCSLR